MSQNVIEAGDYVETPRFLTVKIQEVLSREEARMKGYTEPTHYIDTQYDIRGKSIGLNRMVFAAIRKED